MSELDRPMENMTLRDYFAAKAMPEVLRYWQENYRDEYLISKAGMTIAELSYEMADFMLGERSK